MAIKPNLPDETNVLNANISSGLNETSLKMRQIKITTYFANRLTFEIQINERITIKQFMAHNHKNLNIL